MYSKVAQQVARRWFERQAQRKIALRQTQFKRMLSQGGSFGIMSAYTTTSKSENQKRHGQLIADLQKAGHRKVETLKGQWQGVAEKSVLIPNIKPGLLFQLGRKYGQDSVIYKSQDGVVGMYYPSKGVAELAVDQSALPNVEVADDKSMWSKTRNWSFEMGFLWGQHVPWDGSNPISAGQVQKLLQEGALAT